MGTVAGAKQWAEKYPDLGTGPLSTEPYISEEHFEREREGVFARTWLNVGRVDDLPETGGYFARDIPACGASVLIIRGPNGKVRGFHNVCSHRGTRMVRDDGETRRGTNILCPYHHWRYDAAGGLVNVPDEENFFDLDKTCHGFPRYPPRSGRVSFSSIWPPIRRRPLRTTSAKSWTRWTAPRFMN